MTPHQERLLRAAKWYARQGFSIFPVHTWEDGHCTCGNPRCESQAKHPVADLVPHGVLDAMADEQAAVEWWSSFPDANIGIATGDASDIVVIDSDPRHGGEQTLESIERRNEELPVTWACETGGGGLHLWYRMPDGIDLRNSVGAVGPGVDVRGNGGYVLAPPSMHASGHSYQWAEAWHPRLVHLAPLPDWFLRLLVSKRDLQPGKVLPRILTEGHRNSWLASAAGMMRRKAFGQNAITAALKIENHERCQPPLGEREVELIAKSISRYEPT